MPASTPTQGTSKKEESEEVKLPRLKYGYCTKPLEWAELQQFLLVEDDVERLRRTEEQQREYEISKQGIKRDYKTILDYILITKFEFQKKQEEDGKFSSVDTTTHAGANNVRKRVMINDFPYYFAENLEHWVLWKLGPPCDDEDIKAAKDEIRELLGDAQDFLHWINPPQLKSLPEIDHVHILCLRRSA